MKIKLLMNALITSICMLAFVSAGHAEDLSVAWDCAPFKDLPNPNAGQTRPYKNATDSVEFAKNKILFRRVHDDRSTVIWELTPKGQGFELSGRWMSVDQKFQSLFQPISLQNSNLPVTGFTKYVRPDAGYRECQITLLSNSSKTTTISQIFSESPSRMSAQPNQTEKGVLQNKADIQANRQQIDKNTANIDVNRQNIDVNRQNIERNRTDISRNQEQMLNRTTKLDEGYQNRGTGSAQSWAIYKSGVPFQQQQFCRILENFKQDLAVAQSQNNQIKENMAYKTREQRLTALLPDGTFSNWIARAVSVKQASDGSASVLFELPCGAVIGSHACGQNPKSFIGTIPENSRVYSELTNISVGDFLGVSGSFNFIDEKAAFQKGRSVASFKSMKSDSHCDAKDVSESGTDFFASLINSLSNLK